VTGEPTPIRDNGPYRDHGQARAQFDANAYGIPTRSTEALAAVSSMVLAEVLLMTGVDVADFEQGERDAIARQLDPHTVQVIAGWIIRARPVDHGVLLGMLLALIESAVRRDLAGAPADSLTSGYQWMLRELAEQDRPAAARMWALLLQDRLHRSVDELGEAAGEDTLGLVAAAAPALLAAANLLGLLHHAAPDPGRVASAVTTARANLATAGTALAGLRDRLRRDGFET
jgi:hypothetical protein